MAGEVRGKRGPEPDARRPDEKERIFRRRARAVFLLEGGDLALPLCKIVAGLSTPGSRHGHRNQECRQKKFAAAFPFQEFPGGYRELGVGVHGLFL